MNELNIRYNSDKFEMGVIYGSRCIGKTSLLKEFIKDKKALYFQAKESNELDNRNCFSHKVNEVLNITSTFNYPTFSEDFDALIKFVGTNCYR